MIRSYTPTVLQHSYKRAPKQYQLLDGLFTFCCRLPILNILSIFTNMQIPTAVKFESCCMKLKINCLHTLSQLTNYRIRNILTKNGFKPNVSGKIEYKRYLIATLSLFHTVPVSLSCRDTLARSIGHERCSTTDLSQFPMCEMITPVGFRTVIYVAKLCGTLKVGGGCETDMKPTLIRGFHSNKNTL